MNIDEEVRTFIAKIIVPALVSISVKLALQLKRYKMSFVKVLLSIIIGIGSAWLSSGWVLENFEGGKVPVVIAAITITSEKIGYWLMDRFDVGSVIDGFLNGLFSKFKK
jgi:lipopolysaccharide export LptBFGC system permease protein LptF